MKIEAICFTVLEIFKRDWVLIQLRKSIYFLQMRMCFWAESNKYLKMLIMGKFI